MAKSAPRRTRADLIKLPARGAPWARWLASGSVQQGMVYALLAAVGMWLVTGGPYPPFVFHEGDVPSRNIVARTTFSVEDKRETEARRRQKRAETICVYVHDPEPLRRFRQLLKDHVFQVIRAESYEKLDPTLWQQFLDDEDEDYPDLAAVKFAQFQQAFADDPDLEKFDRLLEQAFEPFEERGLLRGDELHKPPEGNQLMIDVYSVEDPQHVQRVEVKDVRIEEAVATLRQRLEDQLRAEMVGREQADVVLRHVLAWLKHHPLPTTLRLDTERTARAVQQNLAQVQPAMVTYRPGDKLASAGQPLTLAEIELLRAEYRQLIEDMTIQQWLAHVLADFGMYLALYTLCGIFMLRRFPELLQDVGQVRVLLGAALLAVTLCAVASRDQWRAEVVPLLLFAMTVRIAFAQELALLLCSSLVLAVVLSLGQGLVEFVIYMAALATAVQMLDHLRSRTRLLQIGLTAGVVAALTTVGVATVTSQSFGSQLVLLPPMGVPRSVWDSAVWLMLERAGWCAVCGLLAGVVMTGLLPFVERLFGVQTDLSLLELADPSHPLLRHLVQRAPGTYNHSINVAFIAEAAAEQIGANGLLVRVGAYFHDIGKAQNPQYFVENQEANDNRHESLNPEMSILIIKSHVKNGVEMARSYGLPQKIIDFIEQHHGTTRIEYFYQRRAQQRPPDGAAELAEEQYRYEGPKPQTKETAILMLADAAESAVRTLADPTPSQIRSRVDDLAMRRLQDGQFDECGLTFRELKIVRDSIVKSLTAAYHGRVQYPELQKAST